MDALTPPQNPFHVEVGMHRERIWAFVWEKRLPKIREKMEEIAQGIRTIGTAVKVNESLVYDAMDVHGYVCLFHDEVLTELWMFIDYFSARLLDLSSSKNPEFLQVLKTITGDLSAITKATVRSLNSLSKEIDEFAQAKQPAVRDRRAADVWRARKLLRLILGVEAAMKKREQAVLEIMNVWLAVARQFYVSGR